MKQFISIFFKLCIGAILTIGIFQIVPSLVSSDDSIIFTLGVFFLLFYIAVGSYFLPKIARKYDLWGKFKNHFKLLAIIFITSLSACSKVPAGHVGVKVYLLGGTKGVDHEELPVGRHWVGINEELYIFPTFTQNYVWTKSKTEGSRDDESITFQTMEGMNVNGDIGISYRIDPNKVTTVFQTYRRGINEITDVFLRNMVRDAFVKEASNMPVEAVYGSRKAELVARVETMVKDQVKGIGIIVEKIYLAGSLRLPEAVVSALNRKIEATQRAEQRENELREAEAQAKKEIALAQGESESMIIKAQAEAESLRLKRLQITENLVQYEAVQKWDGVMPTTVMGEGGLPLVQVK